MSDPVDELYGLPRREFIAARDRLARKLLAGKQRDRAREVKTLRRPTVAAWVVNQLAHGSSAAIRRLIETGEALRRAQRRVVRGGSADELRAAAKRRQEALRDLRSLAGPILREAGSAAHLDGVLATLEAASVDPGAAKAVTAGRLSRELPRPSGFGDAPPLTLVVSRETKTPKLHAAPEPNRSRAAESARSRRRGREFAAEARRLEQDAARSERAATRASRRAATVERARREHERRVQQLHEELQVSERRLREAEAELARLRTEKSHASADADELRRRARATRAQAETED